MFQDLQIFTPRVYSATLPVVVEVGDIVVAGVGRLRHTVVECHLFHGRVYKMWIVRPPDHTMWPLGVWAQIVPSA